MTFSEEGLKVTISGGGVEFENQSPTKLIKAADEGLYEAKHEGKNRINYTHN